MDAQPGNVDYLVDGLDLSALRLLLAVADLGSVAQAARRVGLAQPSATVKLRKLERNLGLQLIERRPTGSSLTAGGELVAAASRDVLGSAGQLFRAAEQGREGETRLRLAATASIAQFRLPSLLSTLELDSAEVIIDVVESDTRTVAHAVRTGQAMLGLLDGPFAPLGLRSEVVEAFKLVAVVAPGHRLATAETVSRGELAEVELIIRRSGSGTRDVIEASLAEYGFGATGRLIEVETHAAALVSAQLGAGVAIVPEELAVASNLVAVGIEAPIEQPVRLCWSGTTPQSRLARSVVEAALRKPSHRA